MSDKILDLIGEEVEYRLSAFPNTLRGRVLGIESERYLGHCWIEIEQEHEPGNDVPRKVLVNASAIAWIRRLTEPES